MSCTCSGSTAGPVLQVVYKEAEKSPRGLGRPACPPPRAADSKCEPFPVCGKGPRPVPNLQVPVRSLFPCGHLPQGCGFC